MTAKQPTPAETRALYIEIVPFKRSQYDRGSSKIIVDGVEWGSFRAEHHGMHGLSYHALDLHGAVMVLRDDPLGRRKRKETVVGEASFRPKSAKHIFRENIGKPDDQKIRPLTTRDQLREYVRELIAGNHLRHPEVRQAEIEEARRQHAETTARFEREQKENWDCRIQMVLDKAVLGESSTGERAVFNVADLKEQISRAMKWAQAQ